MRQQERKMKQTTEDKDQTRRNQTDQTAGVTRTDNRCCGSGFIGSGSRSSISSESLSGSGSESGSRILITGTKNLKKYRRKWFLSFFDQKLQFTYPQAFIQDSKLQETPSALKREHPGLRKINCFHFSLSFLSFWIRIANSDPYPGIPINPDPTPIRIRIHNSCIQHRG